eukprot:TRINITY_DN74469_c0_g1_i1.p1 TRINITY_DN74469_c0_g1~~TRINITY_DN74469_c0_g1_i1.p1  ORF type:complete len:262 (-),score=28.23 TRINITY_DN74469_c0_g1_i1:322-1107(-)
MTFAPCRAFAISGAATMRCCTDLCLIQRGVIVTVCCFEPFLVLYTAMFAGDKETLQLWALAASAMIRPFLVLPFLLPQPHCWFRMVGLCATWLLWQSCYMTIAILCDMQIAIGVAPVGFLSHCIVFAGLLGGGFILYSVISPIPTTQSLSNADNRCGLKVLSETCLWTEVEADDEEQNSTCSICLEDFEIGDVLSKLRCQHQFHGDCFHQWFCRLPNVASVCPMRCAVQDLSNASRTVDNQPSVQIPPFVLDQRSVMEAWA